MRVASQQQAATYAAAVVVLAVASLDSCRARMEAHHGQIRVSVNKNSQRYFVSSCNIKIAPIQIVKHERICVKNTNSSLLFFR